MKMPEMEKTQEFTGRKKEFLKLTVGNHIIRLLPGEEGFYITHTHWINNTNIECLGEECPICVNNKRIIAENPDTFRDVKGYSRRRQVFYVNVLDKTLGKTCAACGEVNKAIGETFPSTCSNCNAVVIDINPEPVNRVSILNRGSELYENLKSINNANLHEISGEKIGIENYDIMLMIPPSKRPVAQGLPHKNEPVEVDEELLFDVEEAPLKLTALEVKKFLSGASLKDIYALRRAEELADNISVEDVEVVERTEDLILDMDTVKEIPFDSPVVKEETTPSTDDDDLEESVKQLFNL